MSWISCRPVVCLVVFLFSATHARNVNQVLRYNRSCRGGVSYPELGCFTLDPPFTNTRWLPQSPAFIGTTFSLFTRQNRLEPDMLIEGQSASIDDSHFNNQVPTKILVHGFLQHRSDDFLVNITRALLDEESVNVIVVGWSGGAGFPYGQAVANTRLVGAQIARLVTTLTSHRGIGLDTVHVIGHSLGAQIAGYAGSRLPGLGRITGLDPAQPNYHGYGVEVRLDPSDAQLVDVIHTDAVPFDTVHGYGVVEPVGHMDFYPNGGHSQPGCHEDSSILDFVEDTIDRGLTAAEHGLSCSHERSTTLFLASIQQTSNCLFQAFPCSSSEDFSRGECTSCGNVPCPVMGYHADMYSRSRGTFYLNTTATAPFCGHHHVVTLTLGDAIDSAEGKLEVKLIGARGLVDWTEVASGELTAGSELPRVLMSENTIGDVLQVDVRFTHDAGFFSWGNDRVSLNKVKVLSPIQGHPTYYCAGNVYLIHGRPLNFAEGSLVDVC